MRSRTSLALVVGGSLAMLAAPSFAVSLTTAVWSLDRAASLNASGTRFSDPSAAARNTLADATSAARNFGADALIANAWAKERVSALAAEAGGRNGDQAAARAAAARARVNTAFSADRASLNADVRAVEHFVLAQTDTGYAESVVIHSDDRPVDGGGGPDRDQVSAVPEPASAVVFGLGALAVGAFLIKRRRAGELGNTNQI